MAEGNYGARVWCDGVARRECCDAKLWDMPGLPVMARRFHAIVGDRESGFVVVLDRERPFGVFPVDSKHHEMQKVVAEDGVEWDRRGEVPFTVWPFGTPISFTPGEDPRRVEVDFSDYKGRRWQAVCGYGLGNGHEQDWEHRSERP